MQNTNLKPIKTNTEILPLSYATAYLSLVPLRVKPEHRSEMVSQVLFGEYMQVLEEKNEWSKVQLAQDSYEGWIETSQIFPISKKEFKRYVSNNSSAKVFNANSSINFEGKKIHLVKGTTLPYYSEGFFEFNNHKIPYSGAIISGKQNRKQLVEIAYSYINAPYLWGGKSNYGVDCSGFTQMAYHLTGYILHRDASLQAKQGQLVAFLEQAKEGDLAFFDNEEGNITHVGIMLENNKIIHAAKGKVRIDSLDQEGIYNTELKKYTHHLRMVRSYF